MGWFCLVVELVQGSEGMLPTKLPRLLYTDCDIKMFTLYVIECLARFEWQSTVSHSRFGTGTFLMGPLFCPVLCSVLSSVLSSVVCPWCIVFLICRDCSLAAVDVSKARG